MKRVCQVILLFIFASIYIYPDDYLHPIFFIDGKLLDYKWAHNSNNLAILLRKYSEENWLDYIYIINDTKVHNPGYIDISHRKLHIFGGSFSE